MLTTVSWSLQFDIVTYGTPCTFKTHECNHWAGGKKFHLQKKCKLKSMKVMIHKASQDFC